MGLRRARLDFLLVFCLATAWTPSAKALQAPQKDDHNPFGFSCDNQTTYTLATYCPEMAKAGIKWIRGFPTFNVVEPERGRFDWSSVDTMIATASKHNMKISGLFFYGSPWIKTDRTTLPVNDLTAWSTYVSTLVKHCKANVKYWEVWNEAPNFMEKGTPEDYAKTIVAAYDAAKNADTNCQVGLSIQSNNVHWIEQTIKAGARNHFDFIAVHPYETLGVVASDGWDAQFMSIVPTLRKMLKAQNPDKVDMPIWFTEIGREAKNEEASQARVLIKAYTMALAQGVTRINWFEGKDGDSGPMGLLRGDGTTRPAYTAMSQLTKALGPNPEYIGWVLLNGRYNGFVFHGASRNVVAAWGKPGELHRVVFDPNVNVVDPLTGEVTKSGVHVMNQNPVLVLGESSKLVEQARKNRSLPFPWDGDFTGSKSVSIVMGGPNAEEGLHQLSPDASSTADLVFGSHVRDCSKSASQTFAVDPNFLSYTTTPITITAVLRCKSEKDSAGFNLWYESTSGWKATGSWFTVPEGAKWHTQTWRINDAQFVAKWGFNFSFNSDSTMHSKYYVKSVTASKGG